MEEKRGGVTTIEGRVVERERQEKEKELEEYKGQRSMQKAHAKKNK